MTGAVAADSGTLTVAGDPVPVMNPATSRALGIAAIYQQPALFPHLTVAENIAFALEPESAWRRIDWGRRRREAQQLLTRVGAGIDADRLVDSLSMPEQQLVEIAKAVGSAASVLIMDEPTASLSEREVERLFEVVARLKSERVGIIYISHRLEEILSIADRVTVLRDGTTVGTHARDGLQRSTLINLMIGRELSAIFPKRERANRRCRARAPPRHVQIGRRPGRVARDPKRRDCGPCGARRIGPHGAGANRVWIDACRRGRSPRARARCRGAIPCGRDRGRHRLPSRRSQAARRRARNGGRRKREPREPRRASRAAA